MDLTPAVRDAYPLTVGRPDAAAAEAAQRRQATLTKPPGALGRLETLSVWAAAVQGRCPPVAFGHVRVVLFAGDHGVTAAGVSAYPPEVTAQMVENVRTGGAAISVLARHEGVGLRLVDVAVATDTSVTDPSLKVRYGSGRIDTTDALTEPEVRRAIAVGRAIADDEVDAGADLLVPGDLGIGNTTPAAALVAAVTGAEAAQVVGRGTGIDDAGWMRKTAAVRDCLVRVGTATTGATQTSTAPDDPVALLRIAGGADLAAMTGFLAQAAVRRTPVLLDGVVSGAAALLACLLAPGAERWWLASHRSTEPAHAAALRHLDLDPLLDLDMRLGEGTGALLALPLLRAAVVTLAEMATFAEAGVAGRDGGDAARPAGPGAARRGD